MLQIGGSGGIRTQHGHTDETDDQHSYQERKKHQKIKLDVLDGERSLKGPVGRREKQLAVAKTAAGSKDELARWPAVAKNSEKRIKTAKRARQPY